MRIIEPGEEHQRIFHLCLEDWSDEIKEAGPRRAEWWERFAERGARARLAVDDRGEVGGMIQYLPIEQSHVEGRDLVFVQCIWVHGYKRGRGDFQGKGMGQALLAAAEEDARASGAKGMAAWGVWLPFWMRASWFKRRGYARADRLGMACLMWKPFTPDAQPPRWIRRTSKPLEIIPGRVNVTAFVNGWCSAMNLVTERARRASLDLGERVHFREIDTSTRENLLEWGLSDGVYIDGKAVGFGPPPSYSKIHGLIAKRLKRL